MLVGDGVESKHTLISDINDSDQIHLLSHSSEGLEGFWINYSENILFLFAFADRYTGSKSRM